MYNGSRSLRQLFDFNKESLVEHTYEKDVKNKLEYQTTETNNVYIAPNLWDDPLTFDDLTFEDVNVNDIEPVNSESLCQLAEVIDPSSRSDSGKSSESSSTLPLTNCTNAFIKKDEQDDCSISTDTNASLRKYCDDEFISSSILRKCKKRQVPEELKDEKYWNRRLKNNAAAKRSRDARRMKENQISIRVSYLESENDSLRMEVAKLSAENNKLKQILKSNSKKRNEVITLPPQHKFPSYSVTNGCTNERNLPYINDRSDDEIKSRKEEKNSQEKSVKRRTKRKTRTSSSNDVYLHY